jgi:hypothetical protein
MTQAFVISEDTELSKSIERYFRFSRGVAVETRGIPRADPDQQGWVPQVFSQISDWIEAGARQNGGEVDLRNSYAIIDLFDDSQNPITSLEELNPMSIQESHWATVVAMLVLAFPEMQWVFVTPHRPLNFRTILFGDVDSTYDIDNLRDLYLNPAYAQVRQQLNDFIAEDGTSPEDVRRALFGDSEYLPSEEARRILVSYLERMTRAQSFFYRAHVLSASNTLIDILRVKDEGLVALFDSTNLRNTIRQQMRKQKGEQDKPVTPWIPLRYEVASAIDEEQTYAYLNAYTAYRFGYRSHIISSYKLANRVFSSSQNGTQTFQQPVSLLFEDLYLNFPDRPYNVPLSDLDKRDEKLPKLKNALYRIFVTVGRGPKGGNIVVEDANRNYMLALQECGRLAKILYKPLSGIFDVWQRSGLKRQLRATRGLAPGFETPDKPLEGGEASRSHSTPGRLLSIADRLIQRAQIILQNTRSVPDAIHGALLVLEAQEYLGHRTPTTSLEALALKHRLEVTAECMFYGVEYNMDVKSRFEEIERDIKTIGYWFRSEIHRPSELNAEIRIVSSLMMIFRNHNQFDEEQMCLVRIRYLYRRLWYAKQRWYARLAYPIRWYIDFLLASTTRFALAIALWIILLGLLFDYGRGTSYQLWHGYVDAMVSFFGLQLPHEMEKTVDEGVMMFCVAAIVLGYVHLGIFVSHLYSIIARR